MKLVTHVVCNTNVFENLGERGKKEKRVWGQGFTLIKGKKITVGAIKWGATSALRRN